MAGRLVEGVKFPWLDTSRYSFSNGVEAAGAVWVSGQTAATHDSATGRVGVTGDAGTQARTCWDKATSVLAAAGRTPDDITEVVEYVTGAGLAQRRAIAAARPTGMSHASTVLVESLVRPTALVEVEVVAGAPEGLVRLPQILPFDESGAVVAPGDLVGQCRFVLEEAGRRLEAHGLDLSHVVRTVQQTTADTRNDYRATSTARAELLGPIFPASTGVLSPAIAQPPAENDALVAIEVWASPLPKTMINPGWAAYDSLTFSPATRAGDVLFISGTTAWDPENNQTVGVDDIGAQARFIYETIGRVCETAGGSLDDVVKTIEYVTPAGVGAYREVGAVRHEVFGGTSLTPLPASTGVVVAGLLSRQWLIEVEAVAALS